jgi:hypothetical protein
MNELAQLVKARDPGSAVLSKAASVLVKAADELRQLRNEKNLLTQKKALGVLIKVWAFRDIRNLSFDQDKTGQEFLDLMSRCAGFASLEDAYRKLPGTSLSE